MTHTSSHKNPRPAPAPATQPTAGTLPVPGPDPESEQRRRRELRKNKAIATGLLILAAAVYIAMRWLEYTGNPGHWIGYVRAFSEAGMVGALADWFAVTALFRHPLGLKIPHTAIIKRKKDQVGEELAKFVGENFLNAALITDKLRKAKLPDRGARWLAFEGGDEWVSREAGKLIDLSVNGIASEEAEQVLNALIVEKLREPTWGPPLGRGLEQLITEGRTEPAIDAIVVWMDDKARSSEDFVVRLIDERTPGWAPRFIRDLVGARVYRELVAFTADVRHNPDHEARQQLRQFIGQLAHDLQHDEQMIERVEKFKADIMDSGPVRKLPGALWESARATLTAMARDPESVLRHRIAAWAKGFGERIHAEPDLREDLERRLVGAAAYLADNYAGEITGIIGETVQRWDAAEASDRIELMVGKDLQYIRVNGTIVGGLAGLAIYALTEAVFAFA